MKSVFAPWRNLGGYHKILIFGPRANVPSFFCFPPNAFNSHLLWWLIRLRRSHYRKEGNLRKIFSGREPQFPPCFLPAAMAQRGRRSVDDNVCRSTGVWMRKGAGSRAPGLPSPCGGAQCSEGFGGTAEPCCRGGTPQLHTSVPGNISSTYPTCATLPAWQKGSTTSLQGFSISSPLWLRN